MVKNLQNVMNCISTVDDGMDKRLPVKKQGGTSKSSTKRSTDQVYLTESNTATTKKEIHGHFYPPTLKGNPQTDNYFEDDQGL